MCGRFTITLPASILQEELGLGEMPEEWKLRFNVAPTQPIPVVRDEKTRKVEYMYWGLIPSWAKDISIGQKLINARSETLTEKPSFRNAFQRRRCLILADGQTPAWCEATALKSLGGCLTPNISESPSGAGESFLSAILEEKCRRNTVYRKRHARASCAGRQSAASNFPRCFRRRWRCR